MFARIKKVLSIDTRTLALFRIGLAVVILLDLALRFVDLSAHYTDLGTFPRMTSLEFNDLHRFSFHLMTGTKMGQALLFIIHGGICLGLLIGWKTPWMSFLSWIFLVSLQNRNPSLLGGGDILIRLLSFWSMFLPLGSHEKHSQNVFSLPTLCILLQVAIVYWFTVILKSHGEWTEEGTAVFNALQIDQLTTPLGPYFLRFPKFLYWVTKGTLIFEMFGPILAFCPWWNGPLRTMVVGAFLFFHCVVLVLLMNLGIFPYACFLSWILFLPTWFWERPPVKMITMKLANCFSQFKNTLGLHTVPAVSSSNKSGFSFKKIPHYFCFFCFLYVLVWNFREVDHEKWKNFLPKDTDWFGNTLGLDQNWSLFAPHPYKDDGWYIMPGTLKNGKIVEVFHGGRNKEENPVLWEKPAYVYGTFPNKRWAKYLRNLWYSQYEKLRVPFGHYICRLWNEGKKEEMDKLEFFEIRYMKEESLLPNSPLQNQNVENLLLWHHYCS